MTHLAEFADAVRRRIPRRWYLDPGFVWRWYIGWRLRPIALDFFVLRTLTRRYEELTGIERFALRHPRWLASAFLDARRDLRAPTARERRVGERHTRRRADYRAAGVPDDTADRWANERLVRDLRRIGESGMAEWVASWPTWTETR